MNPHMSDLRAVNAVRAHRDQSASGARPTETGGQRKPSRFGERRLRDRAADLLVSIATRLQERPAET